MWVFDPGSLRILEVNDAAVRIYGYTREQFLALRLADLVAGEEASMHEGTTGEMPQVGPCCHRRCDGSVFDVNVTTDDFTFQGLPARIQEISRSLSVEGDARHLSKALRDTLDAIADGFVLLDEQWRIRFLNHRAQRILMTSEPGIVGRNVWSEIPFGRDSMFERECRRAMEERSPVRLETDHVPLGIRLEVRANPTGDGLAVHFRDITGEWRSRENLRQVDERFRLLAQSTSDCIWDHDLRSDAIWVNNTFSETFGTTHSPASIEGWLELVHPEDHERLRESSRQLWESGSTWAEEYRVRRRDGRYLYVLDRGQIIRDAEGIPQRVVGVMTDLTRRRKAELEIARANRMLQMHSRSTEVLLRAGSESELLAGICRIAVDTGGFHLAWVGYPMDDAEKSVRAVAKAGAGAAYVDGLNVSWAEGQPNGVGLCGRVIRSREPIVISDFESDAGFAPWFQRARSFGLRSGICLPLRQRQQTFGVLVLYRTEVCEVTEDELGHIQCLADDLAIGIAMLRARAKGVQAQEEIREQTALIDEASDAICVRDMSHRILFWSKGAERLYGWTAEEIKGERLDAALQIDANVFARAEAALLEDGRWSGEVRKYDKSGEPLMLNVRWTLLRDAQGKPKSILSIDTDITEQKELEDRAMRVQRLESLGTLAGGIAHDLNNLLAPITMAVALLKRRLPDPGTLPLISNIERSAARGRRLVSQVLSFARGADGARSIVHVQAIIEEVEAMIASTFPKSIVVDVECDPFLWPVKGDQTQLCQVLMNLCVNGRDAMPRGGKLSIKATPFLIDARFAAKHPGATTGPHVLVEVSDSGCGISETDLQRIFEPFFTTKPLGEGTGLGLATSLSIVRSHGGFIDVLSEPGDGSTFRVYLPAEPDLGGTVQSINFDQSAIPMATGELVLLVDDEADILSVGREALETYGYKVITACEGVQAVADYALNRERIAAVVTDLMMPVMDGVAVIETIRRMHRDVPIIATSGLDAGPLLQGASRAGMTSFIAKPYTAEALLERLNATLQMTGRLSIA